MSNQGSHNLPPAFQTQRPADESPGQPDALWRMKVTAVSPGGNSNLLTCRICDYTGTVVGTHDYTVRKQVTHVVGDLIFACRPGGGTGEIQSGATVTWHEVPGSSDSLPLGTGKYKVLMLIDDLSPGTKDWDWPRFH
jgi:hypothetical protein